MTAGHFVYILECHDGSYYTGYTTNVERRLLVHARGKGAKYTRTRLPVRVVYVEELESKSKGLQREHAIKTLSREQKRSLVQEHKYPGDVIRADLWHSWQPSCGS